jgi:hypothetical protein
MIDACGWEIIKDDSFGTDFAPHRHRLESVFGYSSACVPSIVSGRWPSEHRNWCYFVYDPRNSPFRMLRFLRWLPSALTGRRLARRLLTKMVKRRLNFRGYFDLYNIPFRHISLYDFTEKKSPLRPGGMNRGPNIFDFLTRRHIPYFVSDPDRSERNNLDALKSRIQEIDFAFIYWPGLDGLLHRVGNQSAEVGLKLRQYEKWIRELLAVAELHYRAVHLYVFSDHGMANCEEQLDLRAKIEVLPLQMGRDYAVVYDSTMARFWFFNDKARQAIIEALSNVPQGRILSDDELRAMNTFFEDRYFGEVIFLVKEGVLVVPSDMGARPIRGMHGYHPADKQSYAMLCSNRDELQCPVKAIPDIFGLMTSEAERAFVKNEEFARNQTSAIAN